MENELKINKIYLWSPSLRNGNLALWGQDNAAMQQPSDANDSNFSRFANTIECIITVLPLIVINMYKKVQPT